MWVGKHNILEKSLKGRSQGSGLALEIIEKSKKRLQSPVGQACCLQVVDQAVDSSNVAWRTYWNLCCPLHTWCNEPKVHRKYLLSCTDSELLLGSAVFAIPGKCICNHFLVESIKMCLKYHEEYLYLRIVFLGGRALIFLILLTWLYSKNIKNKS